MSAARSHRTKTAERLSSGKVSVVKYSMQARMTELNTNEILMYLGHRGHEIPEELEEQIRMCTKTVERISEPRLTYRQAALKDGNTEAFLLRGKDIYELLKTCDQAIFCAVTLGADLEKLLVRTEVTNMADALIMDACASVAVENVIQNFEEDVRAEVEKQGKFLTSRFSPGYGDLPLECQKSWCRALDTEHRIGLNVTSDCILIPRKSVTAVMGISDTKVEQRKTGCEGCRMFRTCSYRKEGKACHE